MDARQFDRRVLFARHGVLAVDKPAGMPTSGRSLDSTDCLQWHVMQRTGGMAWAVHQLDADTSGVNLFTTRRELVEPLKRAMRAPGSAKRYYAWVRGAPSWTSVSCTAPIGPLEPGPDGTESLGVTSNGKRARTTFRVDLRGETWSRLDVLLGTGRTHQVRIHLASLGHPLIGEEWYTRPACERHSRQALHARELRLGDPLPMTFRSRIAPDLIDLEARLSLDAYATREPNSLNSSDAASATRSGVIRVMHR